MRAYPAYAIIFLIATALLVQPAAAYTQMAIPFVTTCDSMFMEPTELATAFIAEYNNVNTVATSAETLDIDFPAFTDGIHLGPVVTDGGGITAGGVTPRGAPLLTGPGASLNVIPFGLVNLALPSIAQTADETYAYQGTYLFIDTGPP